MNATNDLVDALGLPEVEMVENLVGELDYIHLFVRTQEQMRRQFSPLVPHEAPGGKLRVSWRKGR